MKAGSRNSTSGKFSVNVLREYASKKDVKLTVNVNYYSDGTNRYTAKGNGRTIHTSDVRAVRSMIDDIAYNRNKV